MTNTTNDDAQHAQWMNEAIALARAGMREHGGGPFGAVVVADGKIVGRGWNQVTTTLDPTAHAEVTAIRAACRTLERFDLRGCEIYTSCEPCPMCLAAIYWARLDRVLFACNRVDAAQAGFCQPFLYDQIGLDLPNRSLPMVQLGCESAQNLFRAWIEKADKVPY